MTVRSNFTVCCLFALLPLGCESASSKTDIGPTYTVPSGTGPQTIGEVTYAYVATPERQQAVISGYAKLKVGQTRQEVRALLGPPDYAMAMHRRASDRFLGWHYIYHIRTLHNWTDTSDQWVDMLFDRSSDRLYWAQSNAIPGLADVGAPRP